MERHTFLYNMCFATEIIGDTSFMFELLYVVRLGQTLHADNVHDILSAIVLWTHVGFL